MSDPFAYNGNELYIENVAVREIAQRFGTPLYVYSRRRILENYRSYTEAFAGIPHLVCFGVKSNPNHEVLRTLALEGSGADIVSGGELFRSLRAGIPADKIVFAGVGKTEEEIRLAVEKRILFLNVESREELETIHRVASRMGVVAPISLRVNPDVKADTHPHIATGQGVHKFGIPIREAFQHYRIAKRLSHLRIRGIHMHLGSQITDTVPFETAIRKILHLVAQLSRAEIRLEFLDIGGGAGISYKPGSSELSSNRLAGVVRKFWKPSSPKLILEPGRSIVGSAGILVTRVLYRKKTAGARFVIVDAGMNDLIRPALYDAYHRVIPVIKRKRKMITVDIAGPVCETADLLAKRRRMENPLSGDLLAILTCGGYGYSMSSQYNSRPRAAEVMVDGGNVRLAGRRETYDDLVRLESDF
jgi:diaminopimelate decarboxylase